MDKNVIKELDLDTYIAWYASEFITCFPGLYTFDELYDILHKTVKHVYVYNFPNDYDSGDYLIHYKRIRIKDPNDMNCLFHEFTHALRAYYFDYMIVDKKHLSGNMNGDYFASKKFNDADEGMTELISLLYTIRKESGNPSFEIIKVEKGMTLYPYLYGALYFNQLHQIYKMLHGKSLINDYLKGENVYKYIFDVIYNYLLGIHDDYKECLDLAYRVSNMVLTFLADFSQTDISIQSMNDPDDYYKKVADIEIPKSDQELYDEFAWLEQLNKNILLNIPYDESTRKKVDFMGNNFLTAKMCSIEERLLNLIYGNKECTLTFEDLEKMVEDFTIKADSGRS